MINSLCRDILLFLIIDKFLKNKFKLELNILKMID